VAASDFTRSGALVFGASLFANAFNYLFYMLMGRMLSVRDYGAVMSLISVVLVVFGIGSIGQTVTAKLAADLRAAGDLKRMASFSRAITRGALWIAIAIALVAFGLQKLVDGYLHLDHLEFETVAGLTAGLGFALLLQRGLFQGFGAFPTFALSNLLDAVRTALLVPLIHAFGAIGSLVSLLGAVVTAALYGEIMLRRRFGRMSASARLDVRRMVMTAGATGLSSFGIVVLMFYDVVLARHFLDPVDAGLYGAAALAGRVIFAAIAFLPTVLLPNVAVRFASGRSDTHVLVAALAVAIGVIGSVAAVCGIAPQLIIRILAGARFTLGAPIVFPYVLAAGALSLASLLSTYAIARHRFGFVPYLLLVAVGEITAVSLRHGSSLQIVQDILAGHVAVFCVMVICVAFDLMKPRMSYAIAVRGTGL
jgi:O-antigen/teichoic acid export membrane protein